MSKPQDLQTALQDAVQEAAQMNVDLRREMKASVINRPAWVGPDNKKTAFPDRVAAHQMFLANPALMDNEVRNLQTRFTPPEPGADPADAKVVPLRLLLYLEQAQKDLEQAAKKDGG